jgi:hypothetical protein
MQVLQWERTPVQMLGCCQAPLPDQKLAFQRRFRSLAQKFDQSLSHQKQAYQTHCRLLMRTAGRMAMASALKLMTRQMLM